jgi:hypothetical protein
METNWWGTWNLTELMMHWKFYKVLKLVRTLDTDPTGYVKDA